ncbi:MAG: DUF600 family protein [Clostridia bacterium]|nr:DUF600 family protein [Clostridia bacterium]
MVSTPQIKKIYAEIQKKLFYLIPEKWDKIYLYASIIDQMNNMQTGEMYFYYYPKGVIKRKPVNVYEIPFKFSIEEDTYLKLVDELYKEIKLLRKMLIKLGERAWSNITISIENFKFGVEYNYDNLTHSKYTSYQRHLIWRHEYLNVPLNSYNKEERKIIIEYLNEKHEILNNSEIYYESIYQKPVKNIIEYEREDLIEAQNIKNKNIIKTPEKIEEIEEEKNTNQILRFKN